MCSINGFNFRDERLIKEMVGATGHRGPDQQGFYCDNEISLGHARLSIIDLSENARQPLWNEDKSSCIIFNGEIYNFQELRERLRGRGHKFKSLSDTEAILHLYEDRGEKCLEDLNGIFAFAIYDKNKKMFFLARDRIGVKPLYYYFNPSSSSGQAKLIFSSEIKGILRHPIARTIDKEAMAHYFRIFFIPSPFTLIEGIRKVPPAHYLIYKDGKIDIKRYWDIQAGPEVKSKAEARESIKSLLKDSVKRQLVSDRPLGIFLSGGIDSTSILGISKEFIPDKIKTYSVGYNINIESEKFNRDFYSARETAAFYKTDHHELLISDIDARDNLERVIWHMEEPVPNSAQVATFLLAKEAKKEVAVVLGGDGGDEIFGGYPRYYYSRLIDYYQILPLFFREIIPQSIFGLFSKRKDLKAKLNTPPGVPRYLLHMGQKKEILSQVLKIKPAENLTEDFLKKNYPESKFSDHSKYLMYLDLMTWLSDESLLRTDKMTMAFGLEERVPILDHRLVEYAFGIPTEYKIKGNKLWKMIFREAMQEYLPPHVQKQKKTGWFPPAAKWLRAGLKDLAYEVLSPNYCQDTNDYFDFREARNILEKHISGEKYNLDIIWSLICFQIWYKLFIKK